MDLKKEVGEFVEEMGKAINSDKELADLFLSLCDGLVTKTEYNERKEKVYARYQEDPYIMITVIAKDFYRRFHLYLEIEAEKERMETIK